MRTRLHKFREKSDGTVSVEFAIWTPFMMFILIAAIDFSILFMTQSHYWGVARDTARLVARHAMDTPDAQAYAVARAGSYFGSPIAEITIRAETVSVSLKAPANSVLLFDAFGFADDLDVTAAITQSLEPI
ncbi:pilus assembly protein [Roseovarius sp. PS-C2]|uniref:TadE/TadG family type IV pilus assembly protein n=1 Tax=Roseovarius sp. PS-C2 TaxID=2820814 RepID=UPI001C0CF04B|nr:TadE family protein [Roseovarius sp. PS-C2]MBU3258888.1 pilus assembly protein [Roseovarius sp. PS-C2]